MLITDVDGVMTDGGMYFNSDGKEMKRFHSKDGFAVSLCREKGIEYGIISAGHDLELILARARVLNIEHVYVGKTKKINILEQWLEKFDLKPEEVAYIGDDISDIDVIKAVGYSACPADASRQVREIVDIVLVKNGGQGCVREFVEDNLLPAF